MSQHLIIRALHRDSSFLAEGVSRLERSLMEKGHAVEIRDLYQMDFNPVLTTNDFEALKAGKLPDDIATEQEHINQADFIWVIFPIWWSSMPAILKGYIDRIFLSGFAYRMEGDAPVGLLQGKQVIILNSMGMSDEDYEKSGMFDALRLTVDEGVFEFSGMEVIAHRYFTSIMSANDEQREKYYKELTELADGIEEHSKQSNSAKSQKVA